MGDGTLEMNTDYLVLFIHMNKKLKYYPKPSVGIKYHGSGKGTINNLVLSKQT